MHIILLGNLCISSAALLAPFAVRLRPNSTCGEHDRMYHSVEEIIGIVRVSSRAQDTHALRGRLFRFVVLSRPERIVEANGKQDLFKGN
jgi:hypothetical protein